MSSWEPEVNYSGFRKYTEGYTPLRRGDDHSYYCQIGGQIDFGSARDLLRHRPGLNQVPLVGTGEAHNITFNSWYASHLEAINSELYLEVCSLFDQVCEPRGSKVNYQYLFPLGTNVEVNLIWNLGQLRYVLPLRTKTSVHPTLRRWMVDLYNQLDLDLREGIEIDTRTDYEASDRGEQTIKERPNAANT